MLRFHNSNINTLISSFEELRDKSKKFSLNQVKAFTNLQNWAREGNNTAIQDFSNKLADMFNRMNFEMSQEKNRTFKDTVEMFKRIKEFDAKNLKLEQNIKFAEKFEKKCQIEIQKCPVSKNIRDYELKHQKALTDRQNAEFKHYTISKENDASKIILFKTQFKRLNQALLRQNEAERVLLSAMNDLIEQIPDVSNVEEEDLSRLNYCNYDKTNRIAAKAQRRISRLSLNPVELKVHVEEEANEDEEADDEKKITRTSSGARLQAKKMSAPHHQQLKREKRKTKSTSRISCPANLGYKERQRHDLEREVEVEDEEENEAQIIDKLYPPLDKLSCILQENGSDNASLSSHSPHPYQPPPTYSDTESLSPKQAAKFQPNRRQVFPSAPTYNDLLVCDKASTAVRQNATTDESREELHVRFNLLSVENGGVSGGGGRGIDEEESVVKCSPASNNITNSFAKKTSQEYYSNENEVPTNRL